MAAECITTRSPQYPLLSIENKDNETIAENSLNLISEGVDFLKAYEMLTEDQFLTLTAIARKNNLKVTPHTTRYGSVFCRSSWIKWHGAFAKF